MKNRATTCTNVISETITMVLPTKSIQRQTKRVCGLPSAPDRNGLCASCENAIHEMGELRDEAGWMDELFEQERAMQSAGEAFMASNGGA